MDVLILSHGTYHSGQHQCVSMCVFPPAYEQLESEIAVHVWHEFHAGHIVGAKYTLTRLDGKSNNISL